LNKYWPGSTTTSSRTSLPAYYGNRASGRAGMMSPVVTTSHAISLAAPSPHPPSKDSSPQPQMKADIIETDDFTYIICPRNRNKR